MPLSPNSTTNINGVTDRRAPSPKRDNDVVDTPYPAITKEAYDSLVRGNSADVNLEVKRLAQLKNLLAQAMMISAALRSDYMKRGPAAKKSLKEVRGIIENVDRSWAKVPLTIKNK